MTQTSATRKQSAAIRRRMQVIRNEMPYDADIARERLGELTSWKYHVRRNPWPLLGAAAIVGYMLVPAKRQKRFEVRAHEPSDRVSEPSKKGMLGGIAGAIVTMALRSGTSIALRQLSDFWFARANRSSGATAQQANAPQTTHPVHR